MISAQLCVKCQAPFLPKMTGVIVIETSGEPPRAMRLWSADLLGCPICGAELITHFSAEPIIERHENGFGNALLAVPPSKGYVMYSPELLTARVTYETQTVKARNNGAH